MHKVRPLYVDTYYVYAFFKPNGDPFYIGKGINERINRHFDPSRIKKNSLKNSILKKYGISIRAEIIAYFDKEDDALSLEEYLISHYGLRSEGGLLANQLKKRASYVSKSSLKTLTKEKLIKYRVSDESLKTAYDKALKGTCLDFLSKSLGVSSNWLRLCFSGVKRPYLGFNISNDRDFSKPQKEVLESQAEIKRLLSLGFKPKEIMLILKLPKTTYRRRLNYQLPSSENNKIVS
jgi:hypothetical protein